MHSPPENFELLILRNAISSVLRRQFLSKMFTKSIVILCLFLFAWFQVQVLDFIIFILFSYPDHILVGIQDLFPVRSKKNLILLTNIASLFKSCVLMTHILPTINDTLIKNKTFAEWAA